MANEERERVAAQRIPKRTEDLDDAPGVDHRPTFAVPSAAGEPRAAFAVLGRIPPTAADRPSNTLSKASDNCIVLVLCLVKERRGSPPEDSVCRRFDLATAMPLRDR
ncbi:unnamed protein product [Soboliphyme baturini]|uniref:Uncharacterized protein n=1 Tax=Soboliphyme baturini TaxID=241478 RepID=A0A183IBJ1_9BILA|nr:unnamed protein product [Soboliphyme baturini]